MFYPQLLTSIVLGGSRAQQQASFLRERQSNFKQAALKAKQNGDMELAKKYLRQAKVGTTKGLCKVKKIPKIQKKTRMELTPPTHPI